MSSYNEFWRSLGIVGGLTLSISSGFKFYKNFKKDSDKTNKKYLFGLSLIESSFTLILGSMLMYTSYNGYSSNLSNIVLNIQTWMMGLFIVWPFLLGSVQKVRVKLRNQSERI